MNEDSSFNVSTGLPREQLNLQPLLAFLHTLWSAKLQV